MCAFVCIYVHSIFCVIIVLFKGTGGWNTTRLAGYETDMSCDGIDQYWANEISGDMLFEQYLAKNAPVLIRGMLKWKVCALMCCCIMHVS